VSEQQQTPEAPDEILQFVSPLTTIAGLVGMVLHQQSLGGQNSVDSKFPVSASNGEFTVHLHVCVNPTQKPTVN